MRKIITLCLLFIASINLYSKESIVKNIYSVSEFVSAEIGKKLIVQDDDYSRSLSKFDLEMRVHDTEPTLENLNIFTQEQVLDWTEREKEILDSLTKVISEIATTKKYNFELPDQIAFIKTTMNENKGAGGYTRLNYIVLSKNVTSLPLDKVKRVIAHELFHVISRYNPKLRTKLYSVIGFTTCNHIDITTKLKDFTISNPDAPNFDAYITLKDSTGTNVVCAMVLYSNRDYTSGIMFDYMNVGFLRLAKGDNGEMSLYTKNGNEEVLDIRKVTGFFEQIGYNTQYIIHPEEIVASNFELLFQDNPKVQSEEILDKIKEILKN